MIAYLLTFALLEMPVPRLITTEAQWLNMNTTDIQIELAEPCSEKMQAVNKDCAVLSVRQRANFEAKIDKTSGCWIWTASTDIYGYGAFGYNGKVYKAHRASYMFHRGAIPAGLCVLHDCPGGDNPSCVNPAHLFLGTQLDNVKDMIKKHRDKRGSYEKGERHYSAKLKETDVREIRGYCAMNKRSQSKTARKFGITQSTVWAIINRITWRHIL